MVTWTMGGSGFFGGGVGPDLGFKYEEKQELSFGVTLFGLRGLGSGQGEGQKMKDGVAAFKLSLEVEGRASGKKFSLGGEKGELCL